MKRYTFIFRVTHSSVSVAEPFNSEVGNYEITIPEKGKETTISIIDWKEFEKDTVNHLGLQIIVDLNACDIDEGAYYAHIRANYMAAILSFITNATISEPILEIGYETTEVAVKTEFVQYLYMDGEELKQKRSINHSLFDSLGISLMKNNSKSIARAVRWYKKGLSEIDSIDRFMYYWLGLECLNKLLSKKLGETPKVGKCKNCGYTYEIKTINGIKSLFEMHEKDLLYGYKECRGLRVKLQHGFGDLEDAVKIADNCAESCRNMLLKGILSLLKIDQTIIDNHPAPVYNLKMPCLEFKGLYEIAPKELATVPSLIININDIKIKLINNRRAISFVNRIDTNIPVTLKLEGINFIAENGMRMEIDNVMLTPKDK